VSPRRRPPRARLTAIAFVLACCANAAAQSTAPARTVDALLQDLRRSGLQIIYSSELVPPEALAPPARVGASLLQLATEALAAHGLELRAIGPNTYVVMRAAKPALAPTPVVEPPLDEVSVYASRYAIQGGLAEPRQLSPTDIEMVPGSHDDALHALRSLPGLASNASARPYIRGSLSEDVLVRYDGITLVDPFHFKNFQSLISAIDPAAIDSIEVFSGGFPVRYGTRSGGVIDITAPTRESGHEERASVSLISGGVSTIGKSERWPVQWLAAVRRSTLDMLEPVEDGFGKPEFSDSLGRLSWETDRGAWTLGWLLLDDRLQLGAEDDEETAVARYRDEYVWLARDHEFNDALRMRASLVTTSAERERRGNLLRPGIAAGEVDETRGFNGLEFSNNWTWRQSDRSTYSFGAELAATRSDYRYARHSEFAPAVAAAFERDPIEDVHFAGDPAVRSVGLYAANRRKWDRFEAELGVRVDGQHFRGDGDDFQFSPRLNLRYDLGERLRLYGSAGRFTQAQHVEEWRIEEGQQEADSAQVSIHSVIGLEFETPAATRLGMEIYSKRWTTVAPYLDNELDPFALLPDLTPDRERIAPRRSEASGLELSLRKPVREQLTAWGAFTWAHVSDEFSGDDVPRSWDQPVSLTAGLAWKSSRASVSAMAGWHRGWPRTPFAIVPGTGGGASTIDISPRNSDRWGDYYSLDMRGSWTWTFSRGDLSAVLDLTNVTDRKNECCLLLESTATQQLSSEVDHWLPTIINLGFTFRWRHSE
jgi:outer membrane receptor protein involved in Fe transport